MVFKKQGFINNYVIYGDLTIIFVKQRNGNVHQILLDTDNFPKVLEEDLSWHVKWNIYTESYYPRATKHIHTSEGNIQKMVYLYQLFIDYDTLTEEVDHINHNTLDTREHNLRVVDKEKNATHRESKNKNNKSGYRNVSKRDKWWVVQLQIGGVNTVLKKFPLDQLKEAGAYAEKMRKKYYKEYAGAS